MTNLSERTAGLTIQNLCASYGSETVVQSVDIDLERGRTLALLGPSGCGKTTLLRSIAGLHELDNGTVMFGEKVVTSPEVFVPPERRKVGMVFQDGALFPHLSVLDNVLFGLSRRTDAHERALQTLQLVGMESYADRSPGTLSGGQQQRVALARALAPEPQILLLDEPFSALDAGLRVELRREVKTILAVLGVTVVVVTHDQEEAFILGDQVAVMDEGRIIQVGSPANLYRQPASAWVARFVGEANLLDGVALAGTATTEIGPIPLLGGEGSGDGPIQLVVRPEQLTLRKEGAGKVASVEYFGHDVRYEIRLPSGTQLGVRLVTDDLVVGDAVTTEFRGSPVSAWPKG